MVMLTLRFFRFLLSLGILVLGKFCCSIAYISLMSIMIDNSNPRVVSIFCVWSDQRDQSTTYNMCSRHCINIWFMPVYKNQDFA